MREVEAGDRWADELDRDSRGILDPGRMRRHVDLVRRAPGPALRGIVATFWAVTWDVPEGEEFVQPILTHPAGHLSVGPAATRGVDSDAIEATLVGVPTRLDRRRLRGRGRNVAAKLAPGLLGVVAARPAVDLTDATVLADEVPGLDAAALLTDVVGIVDGMGGVVAADAVAVDGPAGAAWAHDPGVGFDALERHLARLVAGVDPERLATARAVAAWCDLVETDRSLRTVADVAREAGVGVRTLQRLFAEHVGVSPRWVIRRHRLLDAADAARDGRPPSWAALAADLGYADQAHLSRDFRAAVGQAPSDYTASLLPTGVPLAREPGPPSPRPSSTRRATLS